MRVIKFRGKRVDNGDLVVGMLVYFFNNKNTPCIMPNCYFGTSDFGTSDFGEEDEKGNPIIEKEFALGGFISVHPETVGQFTGLKDKNGVDIYEGDVVVRKQFTCENNTYIDIYSVIYKEGMFKLEVVRSHIWSKGAIIYLFQDVEVTGNIHDLKKEV